MKMVLASRKKALRQAIAPIIENLESRTYFTAITADFTGGNGTAQVDQYAGKAGDGWWAGWATSSSNTSTSASVVNTSPLNGGGNYVSATMTATSGSSRMAFGRGYNTTGNVDVTDLHQLQLDFRLDSNLSTFTSTDDRLYVFGDTGYRLAPLTNDTMLAEVRGAATTGLAAQHWGLFDGDGSGGGSYVDTGIALSPGTVYHFTFLIDSPNHRYQGTISDGQTGTGHSYSSGWLGFDYDSNFTTRAYVNIGSRRSASGESTTFSFDSVKVTPPPPAAPTGLNITTVSSSQLDLSWTDNATTETNYVIERSTDSAYTQNLTSTTVAAGTTTFSSSSLAAGTTYYYRVKSINEGGDSSWLTGSGTTSGSAAPAAPSDLLVTGTTQGQISLAWTDNSSDETGFVVQWASDSSFATIAGSDTVSAGVTSYNHINLTEATSYYYRVLATNSGTNSTPTSIVDGVTNLAAPTAVSATMTSPSTALVEWTDNSAYESGYIVQRTVDGGTWTTIATLGANSDSYEDNTVHPGADYSYRTTAAGSGTAGDPPSSSPSGETASADPANASAYFANGGSDYAEWFAGFENDPVPPVWSGIRLDQFTGANTGYHGFAALDANQTVTFSVGGLELHTQLAVYLGWPGFTGEPEEYEGGQFSVYADGQLIGSGDLYNSPEWAIWDTNALGGVRKVINHESDTVQITITADRAWGFIGAQVTGLYNPLLDCGTCDGGGAPGSGGGGPSGRGANEGPVGFDGKLTFDDTDLGAGFGGLTHTRGWSNLGTMKDGFGGSSSAVKSLPRLVSNSNSSKLSLARSTGSNRSFTVNGSGGYDANFYRQDKISVNSTNHTLVYTDTTGQKLVFADFSTNWSAEERGTLRSSDDAAGNTTTVSYASGRPSSTQRQQTVGGVTVTDTLTYSYLTSGPNIGQVASVTSTRTIGSGSPVTLATVTYSYYVDGDANGSTGDLASAVVTDGAGTVIDTKHYRYYINNSSGGFEHGLKYVLGAESYARAAAALGNVSTATDAQIATYADSYFEYDSNRRVTKATMQGEGCTSCTGGQGTYTYSYEAYPERTGFNTWAYKSVETRPDGSTNTVYANAAGEAMLNVFDDVGSAPVQIDYWNYDGSGRVLWHADPSAVTGYNETYLDLVHLDNGNYQYIADSAGLIELTEYYTTTTAGSSTPGGVAGYEHQQKIKQGETGTAILQHTQSYKKREGSSATIYVLAESTVYRNDSGMDLGPQTTSYAYDAWHGTTNQVAIQTISKPIVDDTQNGSGSADTTTFYFDTYGRIIWTIDGEGYITYTEYDPATGEVAKYIDDADPTAISGAPVTGPTRGSLPTALHLVTLTTTEDLLDDNDEVIGRRRKQTDPEGNVTYTIERYATYETRVYRGWNATTGTTTGPIEVYREDRVGSYTEMLTMAAAPEKAGSAGSYVPTGGEAIASPQSLSRTFTSAGGQVTESRQYFNLSGLTYSTSASLGTASNDTGLTNGNYHATTYAYDQGGRLNRVLSPTGTITRTVYDGLGRTKSVWTGTNDTGATNGDPTGGGASGNNMLKTAEYEYDNGGVGDSNLTKITQIPGGSAANRVTEMYYDWRNRQVATKAAVEASESTSENTHFITYTEYDNLNQAIASYIYDGDNVTVTSSGGVPNQPSSSLLRAKQEMAYDDQGRVYRTTTHNVNPSSGSIVGSGLISNTFYDQRGNVIKTSQPGGLVSKMEYDGAGRLTKSYVTDGGGDATTLAPHGTWASASNVEGDIVLEQSETQYDDAGNAILSTTRQRFHNAARTGDLDVTGTTLASEARTSYQAMYYDAANRLTDVADVGTAGGSSYTRPTTVAARSDTNLVTSYEYDAAGYVKDVTDPKGIKSRTLNDALGRTTKTIANYVDGTPSDADDQTTSYTYDGAGHVLTLKAELPGTNVFQETKYIYGATTASGSDINSNDVLTAVQYPDLSSGSASSGQQETFTVNALGQTTSKTDRNGTVHTYSYDVLGRQTADAITTLGSGVDGAIRRLTTEYDTQGNADRFTSYDAASGGNVVNQVQREFNGLGQLITEYQAVNGAVNTGSTPKVQYAYSEMATGANHSRLTSMTYPNGRVINYNYASGLDSSISRLTSLSDTSATLEGLTYLGLGTVVQRLHPESGINLTYIGTPGDGGDQYAGLDRFGRVVDHNWVDADNSNASVDRYTYGYDRNGNRMYKENQLSAANSELYAYDNLNRLTSMQRGTLDGTKTGLTGSATRSQEWDLDALGNSDGVTTDSVTQSRTHNAQNQLTGMGSATLAFDSNGNQITDEAGKTLVYDAWNRLVEAKNGSTSLIRYEHDALTRRIQEGTTAFYYTANWQAIEERNSSNQVIQQYVWSPVYVDALIERDRDTNADGTTDERLYVLQDANFNVMAIAGTGGSILERFRYDAYGARTVLNSSWTATSDAYSFQQGHQGGKIDAVTGYIHFRNRELSTAQMRWMQQDPLGFADGLSLYVAWKWNPVLFLDPQGTSAVKDEAIAFLSEKMWKLPCALSIQNLESDEGNLRAPANWDGWPDSWSHCYLGCLIAFKCGKSFSIGLGVFKEIYDQFNRGDPSIRDVRNTVVGAAGIMLNVGMQQAKWLPFNYSLGRCYCSTWCKTAKSTGLLDN